MSHYDVFNGDADGLCARQQLRLAQPRDAVLVTGPKRDIALVARVPAQAGDSVTVLDVSLAGDNLHPTAEALARDLRMGSGELALLRELGEALNYNAYGDSEADLLLPPARLAQAMQPFADPLAFAREPVARALVEGQREDLRLAASLEPSASFPGRNVYMLPDAAWARRVQGVFANALARGAPARAHAVLREAGPQAFNVSVRAPLQQPQGADALCRAFATGGGRAAAAGIDRLPRAQLEAFLAAFARAWPAPSTPATP